LFSVVQYYITTNGRGKKSILEPIDVFFLTLVLLTHNESFSKLSADYGVSDTVIDTQIRRALPGIRKALEAEFIRPIPKDEQALKRISFPLYPEMALVFDVTFQPRSKPVGSFKESKKYFYGKHSKHGFKVETAHAPSGVFMFLLHIIQGLSTIFRFLKIISPSRTHS